MLVVGAHGSSNASHLSCLKWFAPGKAQSLEANDKLAFYPEETNKIRKVGNNHHSIFPYSAKDADSTDADCSRGDGKAKPLAL